jgi:hypothetical protein
MTPENEKKANRFSPWVILVPLGANLSLGVTYFGLIYAFSNSWALQNYAYCLGLKNLFFRDFPLVTS